MKVAMFISGFLSLSFFFWPHPQHMEVLGPGLKPAPQET